MNETTNCIGGIAPEYLCGIDFFSSLLDSLLPGSPGALKTRPDGTVIDGHHRLAGLRDRGVDIDALPREIIPKDVPNP